MMNRDLAGDGVGAGGGEGRTFGSAKMRHDYDGGEVLEQVRRIYAEYEARRNDPFEDLRPMLAAVAMVAGSSALTVLAFWCFGLLKV